MPPESAVVVACVVAAFSLFGLVLAGVSAWASGAPSSKPDEQS